MSSSTELPALTRYARAVVYALFAAAFAWPLGLPSAALGAALFAFLGAAFLAPLLARSALRLPWLFVVGAGAGLVSALLVSWLSSSSGVAGALGESLFLVLTDVLRFGLLTLCVAATLSAVSQRVRWFAFVEVALAGMIASQLVAEHRHGAINRPFEIADPILSSGGDPTFVFYVLGGVAAVLVAVVLIHERKWWRLVLHLGVIGLLLVLLGVGVQSGVLPTPEPAGDGLGLQGKPKEAKPEPQQGKEQKGKRRPDNEMLEFRDQEQNRDQQTPVAIVLLHDDYSAPQGIYYFRQSAFSQYNGRRLVGSTRDAIDRDILDSYPLTKIEVQGAPEAGSERASVETTVALLADHTRPFGMESPVVFEPALNPNPERFRRVYRVTSSALTADFMSLLGHTAGNPKWQPEDRAEYLALPSDPRYGELAREVLSSLPAELADDPMLKVWAITEWISKEGTYSLRSRHASAEDPTADFLFGDKVGYCVHFAHAVTYLLRASGVPARVATGYAVDESGRQGGSAILIQSGAAHAWPEVYLDGVGWVVADAHPERTLDPVPEPPDADLQRLLGQLARGVRPLPPDAGEPGKHWKDWARELARMFGESLGVIAALVLAALYAGKWWRRSSPYFSRADKARLVYRAELDRLAELGVTRRRGESREAFAARVRERLPSFTPLTALHVGHRFGSLSAKQKTNEELEAIVERVGSERRSAFGPWRRLWALFSPIGWLRAR